MKKYRELTAEAVGLIDDRFIAEAADFSPRRITCRRLSYHRRHRRSHRCQSGESSKGRP